MFVGEAPGRHGAGKSGVPFLGDESGRRFEALLDLAGLSRDEVFVTNAVLCNPLHANGNNRRPKASEVKRCLPHLREQIEAVDPDLVVALGEVALSALNHLEAHALRLRDATSVPVPWLNRRLVALYHPGRRALVHRRDELQRKDWQELGMKVRERL
jgi:uracil-DNA glycosylase family 4